MNKKLMFGMLSGLCAVSIAPAFAQTSQSGQPARAHSVLEEVVVTATRRAESAQNVPVAVTALSTDALQVNRIENIRDLNGLVPNFQVREQPGGSALPSYTMRGIVNQGSVAGADKGVAVYMDGVYIGAVAGSLSDIADIERIEVLRGPQGTLFGRNTTGGALHFITAEPTGEFGVRQTFTVGNLDQFVTRTRINTPQWGPFSASVNYSYSERDGDIRNAGGGTQWDFSPAYDLPAGSKVFTSPHRLGSRETKALTAAVKFELDNIKAVYRFDKTETEGTESGFGSVFQNGQIAGTVAGLGAGAAGNDIALKRPSVVNNWDTLESVNEVFGHNLTINYRINDAFELTSITAYREADNFAPMANITGIGGLLANPVTPMILRAVHTSALHEQWSQEIHLSYQSDAFSGIIGGLYYDEDQYKRPPGVDAGIGRAKSGPTAVYPFFTVPFGGGDPGTYGGRETEVNIKSRAVFGEATFHATPQLDLTAGIRFTKDKKTGVDRSIVSAAAPDAVFPLNYKDDEMTYSLNASYRLADDQMTYLKYSTGYISGGSLAGIEYAAEKVKSLEAGLKSDWLDGRLRTNIVAYRAEYSDLQQPVNGATLVPPRTDIGQATTNTGDATAQGIEFESTWLPLDGLALGFNFGYIDFEYDSIDPRLLVGAQEILPISRPEWSTAVSAQYTTAPIWGDAYLTVRVDGNWRDDQYGNSAIPASFILNPEELARFRDITTIDDYWIFNGRVALTGMQVLGGDLTLALWGRNLTNEDSPNFMQSFYAYVSTNYEPARTYGIDLTFEF